MDQRTIAYSEPDVRAGYAGLGHKGYTEVAAIDPVRKKHTVIEYIRNANEVVRFVDRYHHDRLLVWGINERPKEYRYENGRPRSARHDDIGAVSNILIDIDLKSHRISPYQLHELECLARGEFRDYFGDLGLKHPAYTMTGRGLHIMLSPSPIAVSECPDIAERSKHFALNEFGQDHSFDLDNLEARIDSTFDVRRAQRITGTVKPDVGIISRYHGGPREEDDQLRVHLLSMEQHAPNEQILRPVFGAQLLEISAALPEEVKAVLAQDKKLQDYWNNTGKAYGDQSASGFDITIVRRLMINGITDANMLGTALALRPLGSVQQSGKGEDYVRRTLAKALVD